MVEQNPCDFEPLGVLNHAQVLQQCESDQLGEALSFTVGRPPVRRTGFKCH